jgi:hypothetical protein
MQLRATMFGAHRKETLAKIGTMRPIAQVELLDAELEPMSGPVEVRVTLSEEEATIILDLPPLSLVAHREGRPTQLRATLTGDWPLRFDAYLTTDGRRLAPGEMITG